MNPVREGLVDDPAAWPFTGAVGFDSIELMIDAIIEFPRKLRMRHQPLRD